MVIGYEIERTLSVGFRFTNCEPDANVSKSESNALYNAAPNILAISAGLPLIEPETSTAIKVLPLNLGTLFSDISAA